MLSTAKIGLKYVIPAMQQASETTIAGISSRNFDKAREAAHQLGIPRAYGSYEDLLSDPAIDAIYNPLPNHLHVPETIRALEAGKHVLCEKPFCINAADFTALRAAASKHPNLLVAEAVMYRHHPQWQFVIRQVRNGRIGEVKMVQIHFSYYNTDPQNIRNIADYGGGGLLDIGFYCVSSSRWIFGREPERLVATQQIHPQSQVDTLTAGILDFGSGTAIFHCATVANAWQGIIITGTEGRIEIPIPFNPPPDRSAIVHVYAGGGEELFQTEPVNHFTIQAEAFASAVAGNSRFLISLNESEANQTVLDKLRQSASEARWVS